MTRSFFKSFFGLVAAALLSACGATTMVTTPIENIDTSPLKISDLSDAQKKNWGHLDLVSDTIPGMSVDKAYKEIIGSKKGKTVIVAVLDSGIDLKHEDLDGVLWTNKGERAGDGKDNDNNGYVDDIHGWNFLGDSYNEQLEAARIVKLKIGDAAMQAKAKAKVDAEYAKAVQNKQQYEQILQAVKSADAAVKKHLGKDSYTKKEVSGIKSEDPTMQQHVGVLMQMYTFKDTIPEVIEELGDGIKYFSEQANYNYNVNFDGRKVVGDDPYDFNDRNYGNGNPQSTSMDESHGTHVAGIIAAERNNGKGANGVANNVKIMSVRAVPNGDEYDKDIALGIRYAVDNGAKMVSFEVRPSATVNCSDEYFPVMPGTDGLIGFAMANTIIDENLADKKFWQRWANYPLEKLKADKSKYVQGSVGNWLNDASKSKPEFVIELCKKWKSESLSVETEKIIKRTAL